MGTEGPEQTATRHLEHPALVYDSLDEFLDHMVPFVAEGVARGEPVVAAVGSEELAALRSAFGPNRPGLTLADTWEWHPSTASRLRAFYELAERDLADGARTVRLVGEPAWPAGPPEMVVEWQRYESVLNEVLGPFPVTLVCTYPAARLDPAVAASARRTHPVVAGGDGRPSSDFLDPAEFLEQVNPDLTPPPPWATQVEIPAELRATRHFLEAQALEAGLGPERATDLCIAANEVLTNTFVHADGPVAVSTWTEEGRFLCQIEDVGEGVGDPLAGYRPPSGLFEAGRGLWIARQLVDLLQIVPGPTGTKFRLHVRRPLAA